MTSEAIRDRAPPIQGEIVKLGAKPFGFIHDTNGNEYFFYFSEMTGIESDGQLAHLFQGAVTARRAAQWDVTLRVGDKVRFHQDAYGKRATRITLIFDTPRPKRQKTTAVPPLGAPSNAVKPPPSIATRDQKNMLNALCDTLAENGGIPKQSVLRKTVNALRHMEVSICQAPTYQQAEALLQRVCQEEPPCAAMLHREFGYTAPARHGGAILRVAWQNNRETVASQF